MRTGKKAVAVAAAMAMAVTVSAASFAAEAPKYNNAVSGALKETVVSDNEGTPSELTGTISITDIKVKVPVKAIFDIDPNKTLTTGTASPQITGQATNYTITNLSSVPLNISITNVATAKGSKTTGADPEFVTTINDLESKEHGIMFSIRPSDTTVASVPVLPADKTTALADNWLKPSAAKGGTIGNTYKFQDSGATYKLEATGTAGGKDALTMTLYGATKTGWTSGDTFTVTPTFTVSLVKAVTP